VLLAICLNHELYQSLIHVCKEQGDYITPIIKFCGLREVKLEKYNKLKSKANQHQTEQDKINQDHELNYL
jgi:hypothetical protein